jgi:hypothetical protein
LAAAYEYNCLDMVPTAHVCNLEWLDRIFYFIIGRMLCPFSISEMLGLFLNIVNLPVRDKT